MNDFSPFPPAGKRILATWWPAYRVRTKYGDEWPIIRPERFSLTWGNWPFFAFDFGFFHGYMGWKPVDLHDPLFYIPAGISRALPACEFSIRFGVGSIR